MSLLLAAGPLGQQGGGGGGGGIAYVSHAVVNGTSADTSVDLTVPSGSTDDLLVAYICVRNDESSFTAPSGWTEVYFSTSAGGNDGCRGLYYRLRDGTEGATETWSWTNSFTYGAVMLAYSGVDTVTPASENSNTNFVAVNTANVYSGTLPTHAGGDWMLSVVHNTNNGIGTLTQPAGLDTLRVEDTTVGQVYFCVGEQELADASDPTVDTWSWDAGASGRVHAGILVVHAA